MARLREAVLEAGTALIHPQPQPLARRHWTDRRLAADPHRGELGLARPDLAHVAEDERARRPLDYFGDDEDGLRGVQPVEQPAQGDPVMDRIRAVTDRVGSLAHRGPPPRAQQGAPDDARRADDRLRGNCC